MGYTLKSTEEFKKELSVVNPTIKLIGKYKGANTKTLVKCIKCGNKFMVAPSSLTRKNMNGNGCPACRDANKAMTDKEFQKKIINLDVDYVTISKYKNMREKIKCKCKTCSYEWNVLPKNLLYRKSGCPVCSGNKIAKGHNDLWTTNPEIAKLLANKEDGYKISYGNDKKFEFVCPDCGTHITQRPLDVYYNGISCPKCSDGISYPEKFMFNLLEQIMVNFEYQKTYIWSCGKIYDFAIGNSIIETHGMNHYNGGFNTVKGRSLKEEQENDEFKCNLALKNGILNYYQIDMRYSNLEWCKEHIINSKFFNDFKLDDSMIDWELCNKSALSSRCVDSCKLWNEQYSISEIADRYKIAANTVREYLKNGYNSGLCNYNSEEEKEKNKFNCSKSVICVETGKVFYSMSEAARVYDISVQSIGLNCRNKTKYVKTKHGIMLHFKEVNELAS